MENRKDPQFNNASPSNSSNPVASRRHYPMEPFATYCVGFLFEFLVVCSALTILLRCGCSARWMLEIAVIVSIVTSVAIYTGLNGPIKEHSLDKLALISRPKHFWSGLFSAPILVFLWWSGLLRLWLGDTSGLPWRRYSKRDGG